MDHRVSGRYLFLAFVLGEVASAAKVDYVPKPGEFPPSNSGQYMAANW